MVRSVFYASAARPSRFGRVPVDQMSLLSTSYLNADIAVTRYWLDDKLNDSK